MLAGIFFGIVSTYSASAPDYTLRGADDKMRGFEDYQPYTS